MINITKPTDSMGGLLKMWLIPASDFLLIGSLAVVTDSDSLYRFYFKKESLSFSETPDNQSRAGQFFNVDLSGFVPGVTPDIIAAIADIDSKDYVAVFQDGNGRYRHAGTQLTPLQLNSTFYSGKSTADPAGWELKLTGKTTQRSVIINNPIS